MASTPEGKITRRIRTYLKKVPDSYFFKVRGAAAQVTGISDYIGVWRKRFVAIEVKAPGNTMTKRQQLFQDRVKAAGGIAFVAYSVADVKKRIK